MTDFMDRFGAQLVKASTGLSAQSTPEPKRPWWRTRRVAFTALAGAVVTGSALAATQPWNPTLGRPALHDIPSGTSQTEVPAAQLRVLAVLRRPQQPDDRNQEVQRALAHLGVEESGVRTASIRSLQSSTGPDAVLVSVERSGRGPEAASGTPNSLCILTEAGGSCGTTESLTAGHFLVIAGSTISGLVPDGVSKVVMSYPNGQTITLDVRDNYFSASDTPLLSRAIPTPDGKTSTTVVGMPPSIRWLGADGSVVGPPLSR